MTADIIPFPAKPRLVDSISMVESLDSFGQPDPTAPAWPMLGNHRLRERPPVVTTCVLETRDKEPS